MGSSSFVVIPKLKLLIEVSNDCENYSDELERKLKDIEEIKEMAEEFDFYDSINKKPTEITLKDLVMLCLFYEKTKWLTYSSIHDLLLLWLHAMDFSFEVLNEYEIFWDEENNYGNEKYKDYTIVWTKGELEIEPYKEHIEKFKNLNP